MSDGEPRSRSAARPPGSVSVKVIGIAKDVGPVPAVLLVCGLLLGAFMVLGAVVSVANPPGGGGSVVCTVAGGGESPPPKLLPIYQRATERYKLGPRGPSILAAINSIETNFGTNMGPSSAGALGWMQFMPETWAAYGVDGNGDGVKDPSNPWDGILAAGRYVRASGAPEDWHSAIFAYNHAEWYVEDVLETAQKYDGGIVCTTAPTAGGLGELPSNALERIEYVARWIESQKFQYCWGGGHAAKVGPDPGTWCWNTAGTEQFYDPDLKGLDCSGAVRWLLTLTGYKDTGPLVSGDFAGAYPSGPGRYVTIWSNAEHVFITINGRDWGTSETNYAHGPGFAEHSKSGFAASHPPEL